MRDFEDYCWRDLLTPDMTQIYAAYHRERGLASRPALVVVHPQANYCAIDNGWCDAVVRLSIAMRQLELPLIHSVRPDEVCDPRLGARLDETVCRRTTESAFLLSDLEAHLTRCHANGVILCGAPASGALRATAVDSKSFGYKTAVAEDATSDEASLLRKVALFDVAHKYADILTADEILEALKQNTIAGAA